jgi:hypothetical protein
MVRMHIPLMQEVTRAGEAEAEVERLSSYPQRTCQPVASQWVLQEVLVEQGWVLAVEAD